MAVKTLYKYLDVKGGLEMLKHHNLQFTNATRLNDPFDCHPALFDYSIPNVFIWEEGEDLSLSDSIPENGERDMTLLRESTWICSLSKVYNSLLMWSYYNMHKGICIGINMEKLRPNLPNMVYPSLLGVLELEVTYDEIIKKPNYFDDNKDYWGYQVSTKAKDWSHEQEVRLTLRNPSTGKIPSSIRMKPNKDEITDFKDVKFYPEINRDCFESVYLGNGIADKDKKEVVSEARKLNPEIKIYQMTIDPDAFKLKEIQL
jgi:hypothetical protein